MNSRLTKFVIASLVCVGSLAGCNPSNSKDDEWKGWTYQAKYLSRHIDEEMGVVCYVSYKTGSNSYTRPLSCVKYK